MSLIKWFFGWIYSWIFTIAVFLGVGYVYSLFSHDTEDPDHPTAITKFSDDNRSPTLLEIRKEYWPDGKVKSVVPYKKHYGLGFRSIKKTLIPHGIAKSYDQNGTLIKEDPYVDGKRDGIFKLYRHDGTLEATASYKNGQRDGKTIFYDHSGMPIHIETYRKGKRVSDAHP